MLRGAPTLELLEQFTDCPACAQPANRGLCHSEHCRAEILPQIAGNGRLRALMAENASYADDAIARTLVAAVEDAAAEAKRQGRAEALARQAWGGQRRRNRRVA